MNHRGFTFFEVLCVLAIIGILSALAAPDLSAFTHRLRLETVVRGVATDLREMKIRATFDRSDYIISFDPANNRYDLPGRRLTLPAGIRFGFGPGVLGPPSNPIQAPDADGVTFSLNRATFYSQGSNSLGTIYLLNDENQTMAISLSITGRVKIWRWNGETWL